MIGEAEQGTANEGHHPILSAIEKGDPHAAGELLPLVYEELRELAASRMARENPRQTLQATALVHEAYIRLVDVEKVQHWNSRGHFFAAAAEAMRRILVESARRRGIDVRFSFLTIRAPKGVLLRAPLTDRFHVPRVPVNFSHSRPPPKSSGRLDLSSNLC